MEPRGCNRWQSLANPSREKTAKQAKSVAAGCHRLPETFHTVRVRKRALQKARKRAFPVGWICKLANAK
jgi:hypothetical protein